MGQQQILLIVVGVIAVGIAIVVGINLMNANAVEANKDAVAHDNLRIAELARIFHKTPPPLGGGGTTFVGFKIPRGFETTQNGTYTVNVTATTVTITGKGKVKNSSGKVYRVITTVTASSITTAKPTFVTP